MGRCECVQAWYWDGALEVLLHLLHCHIFLRFAALFGCHLLPFFHYVRVSSLSPLWFLFISLYLSSPTLYPFWPFLKFLSTPSPTFLPFSFHLSILCSSSQPWVPQALHCRHHAPPPSLSASPVPLTPHAAPIPRKPLQTASAIKAHSQSARQPVSQPASLLLRLKITVVPVARLLSSSDTHQRSS